MLELRLPRILVAEFVNNLGYFIVCFLVTGVVTLAVGLVADSPGEVIGSVVLPDSAVAFGLALAKTV
ncbi:MAG TPA: hypothetical protein VIS06_11265 [Mycobacteriales bacterium]|jgi:hypothetical protein